MEPAPRKPKTQLKAELEQWRRDMYLEKLDKHGNLIPSSCAPRPRGAQVTCPHAWEDLKWGSNGSAHWAACTKCSLKHAVYYDYATKETLMVGQASSGEVLRRTGTTTSSGSDFTARSSPERR